MISSALVHLHALLTLLVFYSIALFPPLSSLFFFFNDPAPTEIYTLSLHDALPISLLPAIAVVSPGTGWGTMANDFPERRAQMFPRLSAEQIERLSKCGERRRVARGTILRPGRHLSQFPRRHLRRDGDRPPGRRPGGADHGPRPGPVHRRVEPADWAPGPGSRPDARGRRAPGGDAGRAAEGGAVRFRAERDPPARVHPPQGGVDRQRPRRRCPDRIVPFRGDPADSRVPHPQWPTAHLPRRGRRPGRPGAPRSLPALPRGRAGGHLPLRPGLEKPDQRGNRRLPRLERGHRA